MKKILCIICLGLMLVGLTGCGSNSDIEKKLDAIIKNGPQSSTDPYEYIEASKKSFDELLNKDNYKATFKFAINDLIDNKAKDGVKSDLEAIICSILSEYKVDFNSGKDFLEKYKKHVLNDKNLNKFDKYSKRLFKE